MLLDGERRFVAKVLTTPRAPEAGRHRRHAQRALAAAGLAFADIGVLVHGTTLATNAIIERKGAATALIATDGFRDVIEIADESRFDQYDINIVKTPAAGAARAALHGAGAHGRARRRAPPLDEGAVRRVAERLPALDIEAVAVALIHAYANPAHELRIGEILAELRPRISVTLSSQASAPRRASTSARPRRSPTPTCNRSMSGYLRRLQRAFAELGYRAPIHLMTSGGSLASLETAARFPVRLVEIGPAGGAILAGRIALERGEQRILSFDMGGTTAKICLIDDGEPLKAPRLRGRPPVALQEGQRHAGAHSRASRWWRSAPAAARSPASMPCSASLVGPGQRRRRAGSRLLRPRRHASRP